MRCGGDVNWVIKGEVMRNIGLLTMDERRCCWSAKKTCILINCYRSSTGQVLNPIQSKANVVLDNFFVFSCRRRVLLSCRISFKKQFLFLHNSFFKIHAIIDFLIMCSNIFLMLCSISHIVWPRKPCICIFFFSRLAYLHLRVLL